MNHELLREALADPALIQSFSGVRASFGDGPGISKGHSAIANAYGYAYARRSLAGWGNATLVIGRDPRPTGQAVSFGLARGFLAGAKAIGARLRLVDMGIITTPLLQTAVRVLKAAGGVMITASHNPLSDNGFKFLTGHQVSSASHDEAPAGALLSADRMTDLVSDARRMAEAGGDPLLDEIAALSDGIVMRAMGRPGDERLRIRAERAYLDFLGHEWGVEPHCLKPLTLGPALLDPNGGSASGIGARVLEHFGVRTTETNARLGRPEHPIDTDGVDPRTGKHMLLRVALSACEAGARFGVAFDYDADRGNLVLPGTDGSAIIAPQAVAALSVALALAHRHTARRARGRTAVVVSEATSGASVDVATLFGATAFVVETGEINVVTRMRRLRDEGYEVPIGVEGANGGAIFGKSTCRDGLQTALCAALADESPDITSDWMRALSSGCEQPNHVGSVRLPDLLALVPRYCNRMLRFETAGRPHGEVKARMESYFADIAWPDLSGTYGSYEFVDYEGTGRVERRTGDESGGWRVELKAGDEGDFIFARGSRTEAGVWRLIVDSPDEARYQALERAALAMFETAAA